MMDIDNLKERIDTALQGVLCDVYDDLLIKSGDITPGQSSSWDSTVESLADLFMELIDQNK